jgi:phosphomannomutase
VADELDGLTVAHWDATPQWWFSVRASGAGDRVGLLVEAADEDIVEKVRDDVLALVREDR